MITESVAHGVAPESSISMANLLPINQTPQHFHLANDFNDDKSAVYDHYRYNNEISKMKNRKQKMRNWIHPGCIDYTIRKRMYMLQ